MINSARDCIAVLDTGPKMSELPGVFAFASVRQVATQYGNLSIVALGFILLTWWLVASEKKKKTRLPPGPPNWPILGRIHLLGPRPDITFKQLSHEYGDLVYVKMGSIPFVIANSASTARELYNVNNVHFASKMPTTSGKVLGNNFTDLAFSPYTQQVRLYRKIINTHLLSPTRVRFYENARKKEQVEFARSIYENPHNAMKIQPKLHAMNVNIVTYMLFGERYFGAEVVQSEEFVTVLSELMRMAGRFNIGDFIPSLHWMDLQGLEKGMKKLTSMAREYMTRIMEERKARNGSLAEETKCFVDVLLALEGNEKLSEESIVSLILDMLIGGVDTSSVSTEWGLTELIRHPEILKKAQQEIDKVIGTDRLLLESDLPQLPYMEAIAKETLRVHPLGGLSAPRILDAACTVNGYNVPAGTGAMVNLYAVGYDEKYWDKATEFRPARFLESNVDIFGQNYNLLPFGSGRRMCPGAKLGFESLQLALATMIHGFDWELPDGQDPSKMDMEAVYGFASFKKVPLVAVAKPRLSKEAYA